MEAVMSNDYFFAEPNGEHALKLRKAVNSSLKKQLRMCIESAEPVIPSAMAMMAMIDELDSKKRFSSALFAAHHIMARGIHEDNAGRVAAGLAHLRQTFIDDKTYQNDISITSINSDFIDVETVNYLYSSEGPRTMEGHYPEIYPPSNNQSAQATAALHSALDYLLDLDAELRTEFDVLVGEFRHFSGRAARGMTSVRCFGRMYLRCPDPGAEAADPILYYLDHITHESSHLVLHSLMNIDPLILNDDSERFSAPIRPDLRPLYGIYHATYVLSRIVRVLARGAKMRTEWNVARDESLAKFQKGYTVLKDNAKLTPLGIQVLESCRNVVSVSMD